MATPPVTLDFSKAVPIQGQAPTPADTQSSALQSAVSFASQQDPVKYAKRLQLQKITGIPPAVSEGNEDQVKQAADANSIDPRFFTTIAPRTSGWATDPDNAAVSGVDELHRLGGIEQNAVGMRAYTPTFGDKLAQAYQSVTGQTPDQTKQRLFEFPLTRSAIDAVGGAAGMVGNVGSAFGWHGDGPTKLNLLQRVETSLSPEANIDPASAYSKSNGLDFLAKNVAPMIPAVLATGGISLLADTLGISGNAAKVLQGLTVGGLFDADQAGKTYTAVASSGGSDYQARLDANRVASINALPNALFGVTEVAPWLRDNPLLTSLGIGGLTGASGQVAQNSVTGKPLTQGVLSSAIQGAAMQGGMHLGLGAFGDHMAQAVDTAEQSKLKERSPEKFNEAMQTIFAGDQSLRIPAEQFSSYFTDKGMAPAQVAGSLGATNYPEAVLSGGDVEVPPANFLSNLDPEHQKALLPHIVDPASGLTATQHQDGQAELEQWMTGSETDEEVPEPIGPPAEGTLGAARAKANRIYAIQASTHPEWTGQQLWDETNSFLTDDEKALLSARGQLSTIDSNLGRKLDTASSPEEIAAHVADWRRNRMTGPERLIADTQAADAETASTPEYQQVKEQLRQKYVDAGETPEVAETLATKDANAYSNLARNAGMKPNELLAMYNPKVTTGEAPEASLNQSSEDGARGWFKVQPDGSYEIGKTKIGDLSTFVHEPAHAYLNIIGDLAKRDGASDVLKGDYQKVLDFLGAKDGEPLTTEQQETWARANEQYLREGKAPSPGLKGTFQRFAIWLGSVYKKASDLGVGLTDDIRGVFDRLYAAEDGVNKAETEAGPKLFSSAEEAGWTDEQFKNYADSKGIEVEQAKSEILSKLNEAALREKTEAWREEEKNVREAVTADIDQKPEYAAIRALRKGKLDDGTDLTLSKEELVKQFGEDRVKELQKQHPGMYRTEGGLEPETAAEILGFDSAESMMRSLESAPRRSSAIEQATRDYMTAKHGDIRYDGTLNDQARLALENDKKSQGLYSELKALQKKLADAKEKAAGQKQAMRSIEIAPIDAYREAAHQMVESKPIADLQPSRYLDASRKYSREAFDALRKGDTDAAAQAKHKELMNHFLFREATKAKEYIGKFESYAKRMQTKGVQSKLGLAGSDYRDQFNRIMGRYGLGPNVPPPERTLSDWAVAQYDEGKEPAIDPAILNEARMVNYRNAPVSEIRAVHDALVNVRKLASLELGMEVNGKKIEFNEAIANMDAQARESLGSKPTRVLKGNMTLAEKAGDLVQRGDALLMRTERLMEWMDGGKTGPWHDNLWNLAADSQGNEYALQEQVTKSLGDALEKMPKEQRAKMLEKVTVEGIPETVTRHDLVSMAFNMGNEGNLDRLEKTFAAHGWNPGAIENIKGMLTREEWQFVQDGWDSLKPLGLAQAELEKRLTGLPPVMVKPTPLHLKLADGEMDLDGGYYPVVMDPRFSARGAQQDAGTTAQNLMEAGYGRATTSRGNMKERTGFGGPLQLDYEQVLTQHTAKVIKDITHREFMLAANKLLLDPQIRQSMRESLGEGYEKQMMPWLRTIVNDRNGSATQGLSDFSQLMRNMRTNLTLATLSYKVSTSLLQWTHMPRMLLSTNPVSYAQAMVDFLAHPSDMTEQIKGLSPNEMASRGDNLDRDIRAVLRGDPGIARTVAKAGNLSIKYTDHLLSFPLWLSVYRDALKEHVDLPADRAQYLASHAADSAVRLGLGSGAPKDLPPIMRNNDLSKLLTMFYSFHNGIYGQVRDIAHQTNGIKDAPKMAYGMALSVLVPSILGAYVTGNGPKDDENKGLWAAKRALLFGSETIPILRDAASAMDRDGDVKFTPLMGVMSKGTKATMKIMDDKPDKDWTGIGLNYLEVGGDFAGVPGTTQAMKPLRYMHQVQLGNVDNPNAWDAIGGSVHK